MASTDVWKPAYDAVLTYNAVAEPCMSLEFMETVDTFETTNNTGSGAHEFGVGGSKFDLRWDRPTKVGDAFPASKTLVDAVFSDGEDVYTGKARVTNISRKGGGKGGYVLSYSATFTGEVVKTAAP
jgi:hypothetical protein